MEAVADDPGRRVRKRLQMLLHLSQTGARLFEQYGYDAVTMEQIARQADVAKRTLYNHFPTKEALLAYWMDGQLQRDLAGLQKDVARRRTFQSRVACILDASAAWCQAHPAYLAAYLKHRFLGMGNDDATVRNEQAGDIAVAWRHLIAAGQQAGELSKTLSADQLAACFHHLYLGALLRWLNEPGISLAAEFRAITKLFLEGAATPGRQAGSRQATGPARR
ncbi:TetR family transcriptional regulator [Bordetella genomosp. 9]|uniref:TetR/AcrR family transcriptional regulator n=1 Tax=Bordetella genomosp. 9 TaxID=1416803 RepID=UPI000A28D563|nr:TetR family transcriptional regulator [Bordetella genomosp. 9]